MLYLQERFQPFHDQRQSSPGSSGGDGGDGGGSNDGSSGSSGSSTTTVVIVKQQADNDLLHLSEVSSLAVLLIMVWVAVFFNISSCQGDSWDCSVLSVVVLTTNLIFVAMLGYVSCKAFAERNDLNAQIGRVASLFRLSNRGLGNEHRGFSLEQRQSTEFHAEMFPSTNVNNATFGNVKLKRNPLSSGLSRAAFAKERAIQRRGSNSGEWKTTAGGGGGGGGSSELEMTVRASTRTEV
jgi:hypothetical protein